MNNSRKILLPVDLEFDRVDCCSCGIAFYVGSKWIGQKKNDHSNFYCPNGHSNYYPGESNEEKVTRKLEFEKNRRISAELELKKQKLENVKSQKRIKNGVCPCCNRTFKQLAAHMKNKHPEFSVKKDKK